MTHALANIAKPKNEAELVTIKLLYIAGSGRTGSTLLGRLIGAGEHACFGGELIDFWQRGLKEARLCACGERLDRCRLWGPIAAELRAEIDPRALTRIQRSRGPGHNLIRSALMAGPGHQRTLRYFYRRYLPLIGRMLELLAGHSNASILVDSSKFASYGSILATLDELDLFVLHLIRDPRAVAHSWQRRRIVHDVDETLSLPTYSALESTLRWVWRTRTAEKLGRDVPGRYLRVRYEDFTAQPRSTVQAINRFLGAPDRLNWRSDKEVELPPSHAVWGNPNHSESGPIWIREDDAWRRALPDRERRVVETIARPWLAGYGYAR